MASKNVEILREAHQNYNRRDFDNLLKTLADHVVYIDRPRASTLKGKTQFREFLNGWAKGFSDGKITNPQYTDAGDTVVAEFNFEGTNDGPYMGLPATGRKVSLSLCEVVKFDSTGHSIAGNLYYDQYTVMTQLGHLKPLSAAA
jgi:steroid delta-isomerase-like uncharacterized protein